MANKSGLFFIRFSKRFIQSPKIKELYRKCESDFTRNRKFGFDGLVYCLICLLRQNIQIELNRYVKAVHQNNGRYFSAISSSAFVQHRKKLKPEMFYDLNKAIAEEFYQDNDENVMLYNGHRLLSIDGSTINLPVNKETKAIYGTFNNQNKTDDVVIGRVSVLYDVLNEIVLDGKLCPYSTGEVELSREHFSCARRGDIIIMDRAYPSFKSMYQLNKAGVHFLIRCKTNFSNIIENFYQSGKQEDIVELMPAQNKSFKGLFYTKKTTLKARLIRIVLPTGEAEILTTSLLDAEQYPYTEFKQLYFKRWGIETYYDRFKNIIGVEKFCGTSHQFIQQEFNCALYISNMQSILTKDAQQEANQKYKHRKYQYKINSSLSLCFIREKILNLFTSDAEDEQIMQELKTLFVRNVVPVRPDRSFERNPDKYRNRTRPKQFNNRRTNL